MDAARPPDKGVAHSGVHDDYSIGRTAMIHHLNGTVIKKTLAEIVIECGGVGYDVMIPASASAALPGEGERGTVYTHMNVKEDSVELYGFADEPQREAFRILIGVSGVGPKVALSILSSLDASQLSLAVAAGDFAMLTGCPGVGPKLAQRIVLELKDKVAGMGAAQIPAGFVSVGGVPSEAVAALAALGFSQSEAAAAVAKAAAAGTGPKTEELVTAALRLLSRRG